MEIPYSAEELRQATHDVIAVNGLESCYVRPLVYRGYGELGINPLTCPVDVVIAVLALGRLPGRGGARARRARDDLVVAAHRPEHAAGRRPRRAGSTSTRSSPRSRRCTPATTRRSCSTSRAIVADGSGENVFVVQDGVLSTPPTTASCLPGITRDTVIRIARGMGYEVREGDVVRSDLYHADEVFFTGTAAEITPIRSVDDHEIGAGPDHEAHPDGVLRDHVRAARELSPEYLDYPAATPAKA